MTTTEARIAYRWIPPNSTPFKHELGVAYLYGERKNCVIGYRGKAGKREFNYQYSSQEKAEAKIEEFFSDLESSKAAKAVYAQDRNRPHTLKVGDIIYNSWGYDQTNVDWYVVTKTTEHYVWLQEIAGSTTEDGFMSGKARPVLPPEPIKDHKTGQPEPAEKHHATESEQYGNHVNFKYGSGSKWDGKDKYTSWYA